MSPTSRVLRVHHTLRAVDALLMGTIRSTEAVLDVDEAIHNELSANSMVGRAEISQQ